MAAAQSSGDIQGIVRDSSGATISGAAVAAAGPQGERTTTSNADGLYLLELLGPGSYDVTASAPGFQAGTKRGVQVRLGTRVTTDLSLEPYAETGETITITASQPTVDTTTTSTSTVIGSDLIGAIPTGRTFSGLVALAPGVVDGGRLGNANPSISGSSGLENHYVVNGVNVTNAGYGASGSYSIVYGALDSGVNFDFIDAVNVKSAGFEAEYGQALGGVIAVTTKRGTNEFHGSVFGNWQPGAIESPRRRVNQQYGSVREVAFHSMDAGVTLGGPVLEDRLFFFAAVNPQSTSRQFRAPDDRPLSALGTETIRQTRTSYAGTLTWNVRSNHTVELSAFGDPGVSQFGPQNEFDLLADDTLGYSALRFGGHNQILRYTGVLGSFMSIEASVANAESVFQQGFPTKADQYRFVDFRPQQAGTGPRTVGGGVGFYERNQVSTNRQASLKLTHYLEALGRHEIRYGGHHERIVFLNDSGRSGPPGATFRDETGTLRTITTGVSYQILTASDGMTDVYRVNRGLLYPPGLDTRTDYTSFFLQDKWSPIPSLALDLGVRIEEQKIIGAGGGAAVLTFHYLDNFAPRVGASWDFTGRGKGKVFGHYGRYFEKVPNDIAVRALSSGGGVLRVDYYSPDFTADNQIPEGIVPVGGSTVHVDTFSGEPTPIMPGTKSQYEDEVTFGVEYEPAETVNVGLRFIHRQLGRVLEDFQTTTAEDLLAGNAEFGGYIIGNPGAGLNDTAARDLNGDGVVDITPCPAAYPKCWVSPSRVYDALELTAEKRLTARWQLLSSYRLARLYGNYEGLFRNDNGQSDPNLTSLFDFPNNTPATEGQGRKGLLNTDRTHVVKIATSYRTVVGLNLGANVQWFGGTPITKLDNHGIYENVGEVPDGRRGAYGRTPNTITVDVHADYGIPFHGGTDLRASLDVFNLLDSQETATVDQYGEVAVDVANPYFGRATSYKAPRTVRLGLRMAF